jgi:ATP-dependent 26S proteasome regulatory subunit
MAEAAVQRERAINLWSSFARKFPPIPKATELDAQPDVGVDQIGGLAAAKEEVLTYACAATDPEVYARWGTWAPSALLLIGREGVGKTLLARALATRSGTAFVRVFVPRLVLEIVHRSGQVGELLEQWSATLAEMPPLTLFFDELEFSLAEEIGGRISPSARSWTSCSISWTARSPSSTRSSSARPAIPTRCGARSSRRAGSSASSK